MMFQSLLLKKTTHSQLILVQMLFLICVCAALTVFNLNVANGQDNLFPPSQPSGQAATAPGIGGQQPPVANDQEKSFKQILQEIRKNEAEINRLYSSIPIGFPEIQTKHMAQIKVLREQTDELKGQMQAAALRSYAQDPTGNPEAARIVFDVIAKKLDGSTLGTHYDPVGALRMSETMLGAVAAYGDQNPPVNPNSVAYQAFRASYALQDFEKADALLKQIEATGLKLNPGIREKLSETSAKWQRELMIRRLEASTDDLPRVKLQTTEGDIVLELFENHAPQTVGNFISLVENKFYDELAFFLVRPGEFSQAGCRTNDGTTDAGYRIPCECNRDEIRHHFTGTISMVNKGKDTGGSQFFITHQPHRDYDGTYTAFGRVIEGMDVVYQLKKVDATLTDSVDKASKIIKAEVIRKRSHAYGPTRVAEKPDKKVGENSAQDFGLRTAQGSGR